VTSLEITLLAPDVPQSGTPAGSLEIIKMSAKDILKSATRALKVNKGRTALTMLGIVIGIMSIILVMSIGQGAQNLILGQIQGLGSKTIVVEPGRQPTGPADVTSIFSDSLKERELEALKKKSNVPTLEKIMPIVFQAGTAIYGNEKFTLSVFGGTEQVQDIYDMDMESGFFVTSEDVKDKAAVVVIGSKVKEELFGNEEAIGKKIRIKDKNLRVIGVLAKKGQVSFFNFDSAALVPYTTAQDYLFGIKHFNEFVIQAQSEATIEQTVQDVKRTLRDLHNITDPEKDDFTVQTQADLAKTVSSITDILTYFLAMVAAISLLVGGIGIMNIMLVSVTERTREIGLRKAIGAKNNDILTQFLFESVILTCLGGAIGIFFGIVLSVLGALVIGYLLGQAWPLGISFFAILLGFSVSAFIGIVFGIYPARRASKLNPIEALRYE
jgi:putative ABC transport system permease protein